MAKTLFKKFGSFLSIIAIMFALNIFVPATTPFVPQAHAAENGMMEMAVDNLDTGIYNTDNNNILATKVKKVVKIVGGVGASAFVLAILIITLMIIFGSISPQNMGTYWKALFSCIAGAFVFFSAFAFSGTIANLAFQP